jgi:hypothetical protein
MIHKVEIISKKKKKIVSHKNQNDGIFFVFDL